MATVAHALTTKEKVKDLLNISVTTHDHVLDSLINGVTDWIESKCGDRRFARTTHSAKIYDSKGTDKLFLPHYPIASITSLEYRQGTWSSPTWQTYNANSYMLYGDAGYIHFSSKINKAPQYFRITYVAGYLIDFSDELNTSVHTLPFDLTQTATEMVSRAFDRRYSQGKKSESVEGQSVNWMTELEPSHQAVLTRYRNSFV